jgi:hypothetical protein
MGFSEVFADRTGHPLVPPSVLAALLARGPARWSAPSTPEEAAEASGDGGRDPAISQAAGRFGGPQFAW